MERCEFSSKVYNDTNDAIALIQTVEDSFENITPERVMLWELDRGLAYVSDHSSDCCFKVVKIGYSVLGKPVHFFIRHSHVATMAFATALSIVEMPTTELNIINGALSGFIGIASILGVTKLVDNSRKLLKATVIARSAALIAGAVGGMFVLGARAFL